MIKDILLTTGYGKAAMGLGFLSRVSLRWAIIVAASPLALALSGCLAQTGPDSWQHYVNGGMFDTGGVSLSPDGQYLAYASACTGHGDIYVIKSGANTPARLTHSDDFESDPAFTPDGKRIVYVREHEQRSHVWVMDSDGTHATQLTQGDFIDAPRQISHDGGFLLFSRARPSSGLGLTVQLYLLRLDDPGREPVNVGDDAVISGDSRSLICWESDKLWRMDLRDKTRERRRIVGTGIPLDASYDGKLILTLRSPPPAKPGIDQEIWLVDTEKNTEKRIAAGFGASFLGPKSTHVLFFSGYEPKLYVATTSGASPVQIQFSGRGMSRRRLCLESSGAVLAAGFENRGADYQVILVGLESRRATTIASIGCSSVTFQSPVTGKKP